MKPTTVGSVEGQIVLDVTDGRVPAAHVSCALGHPNLVASPLHSLSTPEWRPGRSWTLA